MDESKRALYTQIVVYFPGRKALAGHLGALENKVLVQREITAVRSDFDRHEPGT